MGRRASSAIALTTAVGLALAGCAGGNKAASSGGATEFSVLVTTENTQTGPMFNYLKQNSCADAQQKIPYTLSQTPSADMQAKIQLLGGQQALPVMYAG